MPEASIRRTVTDTESYAFFVYLNANEGMTAACILIMYKYRVAFIVNGEQLNAWFESQVEYTGKADQQNQFREIAITTVREYLREARLREARSVPATGTPEAFAIWSETLPKNGPFEPLDAFETIE